MTEKLIALRTRTVQQIQARVNGDAGQGSLEYIGAILVAAAVVALVLAAFGAIDLGGAVQDAVDAITGGGEG
jgi:hypothetical protein